MIRYGENRVYVLNASIKASPCMAPLTLSLSDLAAAGSAPFSPGSTVVVSAGPRSTNQLARYETSPENEQVAVRFDAQSCSELFTAGALPAGWKVEACEAAVVNTGLFVVNTILELDTDAGAANSGFDPLADPESVAWQVMAAIETLFPLFDSLVRALEKRGLIETSTELHWGTPPALEGHADLQPRGDYMVDSHFFLTPTSSSSRNRLAHRLGSQRWSGTVGTFTATQFWSTTIWEANEEVQSAEALFPLMDVDTEFLGEIKVIAGATARYTILLKHLLKDNGALTGAALRSLVFQYGYMVNKVRESTRLMTEENRRYYEQASAGAQYETEYEAWRHYEQLVLAAADGRDAGDLARREWGIQITVLVVTMIALLAVIMDAYNFLSVAQVLPPVTRERLLVLVVLILILLITLPSLLRRLNPSRR